MSQPKPRDRFSFAFLDDLLLYFLLAMYADSIRALELNLVANLNNFRRAVSISLLALILCGTACAQRRDKTIFQFRHTAWTAKEGAMR